MNSLKKDSQPCSVIILAAGKSSRMGFPKFGLKFNKELTFLEEIIRSYRTFSCEEIIIVLSKEGENYIKKEALKIPSTCNIVINSHVAWERFYSIKLGMQNLVKKHPVFIHNVDNPFVNMEVLKTLISQDITTDYIVPTYNGRGGHPILLSNSVCQAIILEKNHDLIFSNFLKQYKKMRLAVDDPHILVNINTTDAYKALIE